tara:strand:+ start:1518 stop:2147 length:630 start_codon:yes stop_codon:yes gene_type:complete
MWKKISIQIFLLLLVIFLIFIVYKIYFKTEENIKLNKADDYNEKIIISSDNKLPKELKKNQEVEEDSNLVKNLKYVSKDILGNEYIITSKYSELNLESVNIINMREVSAKITMLDREPLFVTSEFAKYNNKSYETTFFGNVVINYLDNLVNSEKFNISIENNFANVSEDVIYQNRNVKLEADRIEIDLITKNSKIFMFDENKKVKIINK